MFYENQIWIGKSGDEKVCIHPRMANRHGLIAGATGTGKTITLKVLAEAFSSSGVPVFLADVKGDLAGMCMPGEDSESMRKRIVKFGLADTDFSYHPFPTCFWDIFGEMGHPLRTTVSEMGPLLLGQLLDLTATQTDILNIVFRIADDSGLLLVDIKDLRSMLMHVGENYKEYTLQYGNITKQSVGAITRKLLSLEDQGGSQFFGEPALDIHDWMRFDSSGRGYINILHCAKLINTPTMYATFMLWLISELFEVMPEVGDCEKPRMVFFFDEAHLLFNDAPKALLQKVEQVVKLIRSKGVGLYFITQSPSDLPDEVLAQLGNRVQHALRAFTPAEQKAVKTAAQTFRANPEFDTSEVITQMGVGEALISCLEEDGKPAVVKRCFVLPPESKMGPITDAQRQAQVKSSQLSSKYDTSIDRDSAYEYFQRKAKQDQMEEEEQLEAEEKAGAGSRKAAKGKPAKTTKAARSTSKRATPLEKAAGSAMSAIGRELGRNLVRGLFSNLKF